MRRTFTKKPPSDEFFDMVQIRTFFSGKKAEIAHLDESSGQDVLEKTIDERKDIQSAGMIRFGFAIFVLKDHLPVIDTQYVSVGNSHAIDIWSEVLQRGFTGSNRFNLADPFFSPGRIRDLSEKLGFFQLFPEISTDQPGQGFIMDKEIRFCPFPPIADDPAPRDKKMDMGMVSDHLSPGLEDTDYSDLSSKKPLVPCEGHDSPGRGPEEERIERFLAMSNGRS